MPAAPTLRAESTATPNMHCMIDQLIPMDWIGLDCFVDGFDSCPAAYVTLHYYFITLHGSLKKPFLQTHD